MLPHYLCSHIQNAFRARHQHVAVNHTTQNLAILSILLRAGFLVSVTCGTPEGPSPDAFNQTRNPAQQRIWAELKYRDDRPVLRALQLVSKPSRRIFLDPGEVRRICSGRRAKQVVPLGMGEVAVVQTSVKEYEWLEAREAIRLGLGGEVLCRAQ